MPSPTAFDATKAQIATLLNWGPYAYVAQFVTAVNTPAGDGTLGGVSLGLPVMAVNTTFNTQIGLGLNSPMTVRSLNGLNSNAVAQNAAAAGVPAVTVTQPGQWYATGQTIPFDKTALLAAPSWPAFRAFEGAAVSILFVAGLMGLLMPKQVV